MTTPSSPARFPWIAVIGVAALALVGITLLVLALSNFARGAGNAPAATATPLATQLVLIPTTTSQPPTATLEPTATPTEAPSVTEGPAATETPAPLLTITKPANVRTGPGLDYPVVAGINTGETLPAIGRDGAGEWFAISFAGGPNGVGWVSSLVATLDGLVNDLPIIEAAPPPPTAPPGATPVPPTNSPLATAVPPTNTPAVSGARGIISAPDAPFRVENTSVAVNQDIWFDFKVINTTNADVAYGALAAHTDQGFTARSWTNEILRAGQSLTWRDHLNISQAGTYQVYLGICFSSKDACLTGGAAWDRLSPSITVTVQ
jgi:SH3 domain-containing protein